MMEYGERKWSEEIIEAITKGIEGGKEMMKQKLPRLSSGLEINGEIATYGKKNMDIGKIASLELDREITHKPKHLLMEQC